MFKYGLTEISMYSFSYKRKIYEVDTKRRCSYLDKCLAVLLLYSPTNDYTGPDTISERLRDCYPSYPRDYNTIVKALKNSYFVKSQQGIIKRSIGGPPRCAPYLFFKFNNKKEVIKYLLSKNILIKI